MGLQCCVNHVLHTRCLLKPFSTEQVLFLVITDLKSVCESSPTNQPMPILCAERAGSFDGRLSSQSKLGLRTSNVICRYAVSVDATAAGVREYEFHATVWNRSLLSRSKLCAAAENTGKLAMRTKKSRSRESTSQAPSMRHINVLPTDVCCSRKRKSCCTALFVVAASKLHLHA